MTKAEKILAAEMLELAADQFANHGCNDYEIVDTPELRELLILGEMANDRSVSRQNAEDSITSRDGRLMTMDWLIMALLAKRLRAEVAE